MVDTRTSNRLLLVTGEPVDAAKAATEALKRTAVVPLKIPTEVEPESSSNASAR